MAKPKRRTAAQLFAAMSREYEIADAASEETRATLNEVSPDEAVRLAEDLCDRALASRNEEARERVGFTCLWTLSNATKRLPAKYDPLISSFGDMDELRDVYAKLTPARAAAILAREGRDHTRLDRVFQLVDLAPEALERLIEHYRKREELGYFVGNSRLTKHAKTSKRIAAIIKKVTREARAAEKKRPKPPPPPPKVAPLEFVDPAFVGVDQVAHFDDVALAQWRAAASSFFVGNVRTPKAYLAKLAANGMESFDGMMCVWTVKRDGVHAYDLWMVWIDNGVVFPANEPKRAGVYLIQGDWQATDSSAASEQLERDFAASAPSDLWGG